MTVLGRGKIEEYLRLANVEERLFVTPILDPDQIGGASIDLRLGSDFVTVRRGNIESFDPARLGDMQERFRTPHHLNRRDPFFLHPNEMALASTLEYVRLPLRLAAYVTSRSKWGRLGLIIATATAIHPGFAGTITLELVNHGNVPIVLYPGLKVAQLILQTADMAVAYSGSLSKQTGPHTTNPMSADELDAEFWFPPTKKP
jgi:dCTP deaminase